MHISGHSRTVAPRSLVGVALSDPPPDSQTALKSLEEAGELLLKGRTSVLPASAQILEAAAQADGLSETSRQLLQEFVSPQLPVEQVGSLLRQTGLQEVAHGRVSANYEHHFDMHYGSNGGFRGSNSYDSPGETPLARFAAYQKPGAQPEDPALVQVHYTRPGFVGPTLSGTLYDGQSGSESLFFTQNLSQVQGLSGDLVGEDEACKSRLEELFTSLDQASPVQLHNYTTGYGRVGTYQHDGLRIKGHTFTEQADTSVQAGAAALCGMRQILKLSETPTPAQQAPQASAAGRILGSLALGTSSAVVGTLLSQMHPVPGALLAALTLGNCAAVGGYLHSRDSRDFPLPSDQSLTDRNAARSARGLQNGLLLGAAMCGSAAAGAVYGWPGVIAAGALCAGAEALLA